MNELNRQEPVEPTTSPSSSEERTPVSVLESEVIDYFVHLALSLSLPRSVGALFGYLYCSDRPQAFDDIVERLQISRGSASQGLRLLESAQAVHRVFLPGDRRTHYRAEISLRALFAGLVENKVRPHLQSSEERLEFLSSRLAQSADDAPTVLSDRATLQKRLDALRTWHRKARQMLPWITRLAAKNR